MAAPVAAPVAFEVAATQVAAPTPWNNPVLIKAVVVNTATGPMIRL